MNRKKRKLNATPANDRAASLTSNASTFLAAWMSAIALAFYGGGYLGQRIPRPAFIIDLIELLFHAGHVLVSGLWLDMLLAGLLWLAFWALGDALYRLTRLEGSTAVERVLISTGLGAGTASLVMLGLGLAGAWHLKLLRALFAAGALWGIALLVRPPTREDAALPESRKLSPWASASLVLIVLACALTLLASAAPETFYDSLVYHLALPRLYLLHSRIIPTPWNLYSGLPFGIEMLYGLALALTNEHLAILLHASFGWAGALALGAWLRRRSSRDGAVLGILVYALCPVVLAVAWQSGVDLGTAFYFALALIALSRALEMDAEAQSRRWSLAGGLLLGFALGTKYTALPLLAAFVLVHAWLSRRAGKSLSCTVWLATAAALAFMPWPVKNAFFYGDPAYPFLNAHLGSTHPAQWSAFLAGAHKRDLATALGTLSGWKETLFLPWTVMTDAHYSYRVSLAYLVLLPWAFFRRSNCAKMSWTLAITAALIGFSAWTLTSTLIRFLIPTLLIAAAALAAAAEESHASSGLRAALWLFALAIGVTNLISVYIDGMSGPHLLGKWNVLRAYQSQSDYLRNEHVSYGQPPYAALEFINEKLPPDAKVLFLGDSRAYYCDRDFIAPTVYDSNPFWIAAKESKSPAELDAKLKAMGITHIFLNASQLYANASLPSVLPRATAQSPIFRKFWTQDLTPIFEKRNTTSSGQIYSWLVIYKLTSNRSGNHPHHTTGPLFTVIRGLQQQTR